MVAPVDSWGRLLCAAEFTLAENKNNELNQDNFSNASTQKKEMHLNDDIYRICCDS
jgi:hypothetical protein